MAVPVLQGTATSIGQGPSGPSDTIACPTGRAVGEVLVLITDIYSDAGTDASSTLTVTGFTKVGTTFVSAGAQSHCKGFFWRPVDGTEGANFTINHPLVTTAGYVNATCQRISGASTTSPIDAFAFANSTTADSACPEVTTTGTDRLVLTTKVGYNESALSTPATYTNAWTYDVAGFAHVWSKSMPTAGATGTPTSTHAADPVTSLTVAIQPPASDQSATIDPAVITLTGVDLTPSPGAGVGVIDPAVITLAGVDPTPTASGVATATIDPGVLTLTDVSSIPHVTAAGFPATVSVNGRYITDGAGNAWFITGDAGWAAAGMLDDPDWEGYLDDLGPEFNAVLMSAIEGFYSTDPPDDQYTNNPYLSTMFQSTPNSAYWGHITTKVEAARVRNKTVLMTPAYIGFNVDGLATQIANASVAQMRAYGEFIGALLSPYPNVIWVIGGDRTALSAALLDRMDAMAEGIRSVNAQLITGHQADGSTAVDVWGTYPWLQLNNSYTIDQQPAQAAAYAYAQSPTRPTFGVEGLYEQERDTPHLDNGAITLRSQAWGAACSGSFGHVFGNNPRWHFQALTSPQPYPYNGTWPQSLFDPVGNLDAGTAHMRVYATFWATIPFETMVPDTMGAFIVSGGGSGQTLASALLKNEMAVVYTLDTATIELDFGQLTPNTVAVRRVDPTDGSSTSLGIFSTTGLEDFPHPGDNAFGDPDWVYVIEGVGDPQSANIDPAVITLSGVEVVPTAGASSATIDTASLTLSAPDLTPEIGDITATIDPAIIILSGVDPTPVVSGGAVSTIDPAIMTLLGVDIAPGEGVISANIDTAIINISAPELTPVVSGLVSATIDPAVILLVAVDLVGTGTGTATAAIDSAVIVLLGVDLLPNLSGDEGLFIGVLGVDWLYVGSQLVDKLMIGEVQVWP